MTLRRSLLVLSVVLGSTAVWSNEGMLPAGETARAPIPELVLRKTEIACANPQTSPPPAPIGCTID